MMRSVVAFRGVRVGKTEIVPGSAGTAVTLHLKPEDTEDELHDYTAPWKIRELVTKYFNGIAPGPALAKTEEWIPKLDRNIRDEMQDAVPQARIYRVYHAPAWRDPELQHLGLFGQVLAGSRSARLDRRLVYDKALATSVSAGVGEGELGSTFRIVATLKEGVDPALVEREIDALIEL